MARFKFYVANSIIYFEVLDGIIVAKGCTINKPCCVQKGIVYTDNRWYDYIFGSAKNAEKFIDDNGILIKKLRLTTLGYDRTDRVYLKGN